MEILTLLFLGKPLWMWVLFIGIVLTEKNAVFGTRGKHPVGLIHAFSYQIVNQYADVSLVSV